jgi:GNAT superfamily N-acetyltransferase
MSAFQIRPISDSSDLERAYEVLLQPTFPRTELVDLAKLVADSERGLARSWAAVDPAGRVSGVAIVDVYDDADAVLLSYLAVSPACRGHGVGGRLLGAVLSSGDLDRYRQLYLEVDDPRIFAADDAAGDPWARLRFYQRFGAKAVDIAYRQPPVRPGGPEVSGMILCRLPERTAGAAAADHLHADDLRAFLRAIGASVEVPEGQDTVALLALDDVSRIPLSR